MYYVGSYIISKEKKKSNDFSLYVIFFWREDVKAKNGHIRM